MLLTRVFGEVGHDSSRFRLSLARSSMRGCQPYFPDLPAHHSLASLLISDGIPAAWMRRFAGHGAGKLERGLP
jgi:hypothetical protein